MWYFFLFLASAIVCASCYFAAGKFWEKGSGELCFFTLLSGTIFLILTSFQAFYWGHDGGLFDAGGSPITMEQLMKHGDGTYTVVHQESILTDIPLKHIAVVRSSPNGQLYLVQIKQEKVLPEEFSVFTYPGKKPEILPSEDGQVQLTIPVSPPLETEADDTADAHPPTAEPGSINASLAPAF